MPGSPAEGYGCQTFGRFQPTASASATAEAAPYPAGTGRTDVIEVGGDLLVDTLWDADLVRVIDNVTVTDGVTLTITPGTRVEFADYYKLAVQGRLWAVGTPGERIVFTTDEPELFAVDATTLGCWNGLWFDETPATNAPSRLAYGVLEYSKSLANQGGGLYPYGGGALSVVRTSQLTVENCTFRHNVADYGGAVFCYRQGNPVLRGNLIVDNHALGNASAVYSAYSFPRLYNNTIVRNTIHNANDPYIESCAIYSFLGKPQLLNNIIRGNDPEFVYLHTQLWSLKDYYTHYNNIEGYAHLNDDIDADPVFVSALGADGLAGTFDDNLRLQLASPSLDAGSNDWLPVDLTNDLDGVARVYDGDQDGQALVDMGAFEAGDCDGDGVPDADELLEGAADCNRNGLPDECEVEVFATATDCNGNGVLDECEALIGPDYNNDGSIDVGDYVYFADCLAGPGAVPAPTDQRCWAHCTAAFDGDTDGDVDLADYESFSRALSQ